LPFGFEFAPLQSILECLFLLGIDSQFALERDDNILVIEDGSDGLPSPFRRPGSGVEIARQRGLGGARASIRVSSSVNSDLCFNRGRVPPA
jgi:hypothetical protein